MVVLDSHLHLWDLDKYAEVYQEFPKKEMERIFKSFWIDNYENDIRETTVKYALHVQCTHTYEENRIISSLINQSETILGYVGWADLDDPDISCQLKQLKQDSNFKGIRECHNLSADRLSQKQVIKSLSALAQYEIPFDVLTHVPSFKHVSYLAKQIPNLKMILDHCGNPDIKLGWNQYEEWRRGITELASFPNIYCKLSGLIELSSPGCDLKSIEPYFQHCIESFGINRCLFASNWPVCNLSRNNTSIPDDNASIVQTVLDGVEPCLAHLEKEDREKIFLNNSLKVYGLKLN